MIDLIVEKPTSDLASESMPRQPAPPVLRAAISSAVIMVGLVVLFSISGFPPGLRDILFALYITAFVMYMLLRTGQFAERVNLRLSGPKPTYSQQKLRSALQRDRIHPLDEPRFIKGLDASSQMTPSERVIGITYNGLAKAYPLSYLSIHEIVNDDIGDTPIAVTWSPVCYAPRAFLTGQTSSSQRVVFGNSGKMLLNSSVYYDRETESLWLQFLGQAISGSRIGENLTQIPACNTTWEAWFNAYPETYVMEKEESDRQDIFETYYASSRPGIFKQKPRDYSWAAKDIVLGLTVNNESRAYPLPLLNRELIVQQELWRKPVLIALESPSLTVVAFDRLLDGRVLSFTIEKSNSETTDLENDLIKRENVSSEITNEWPNYQALFIRDRQTNSLWRAISGHCEAGELVGKQLQPIPSSLGFWFAWSRFYPMGEVMLPQAATDVNQTLES